MHRMCLPLPAAGIQPTPYVPNHHGVDSAIDPWWAVWMSYRDLPKPRPDDGMPLIDQRMDRGGP
jgi:hypothetical protein